MEPPPSRERRSDEVDSEPYHRGLKWVSWTLAAGAALSLVTWRYLRWKPSRVSIDGISMSPLLEPGDWVLVITPRRYRRGDIVVVEHPERARYEMVKRIAAVPGDFVGARRLGPDEWWVQGDHEAASTDSRHFGSVAGRQLKAKAVLVYLPAGRRRIVR